MDAAPDERERVGDAGEFGLLDRFPEWFAPMPAPAVTLGSGDDCALLRASLLPDAPEVSFTTDHQIEGVHFHRDWLTPFETGWRALSAAASDVAAMGGHPLGAVVALALPADTPVDDLRSFGEGLRACGEAIGCPIVGGNLARAPGGWHITTSVVGSKGAGWVRSGVTPGDSLYVTGFPGRAHAGLRVLQSGLASAAYDAARKAFRRPLARFAAVDALAAAGSVTAAIDCSDSLARSLERLATASGVALRVEARALPSNPVAEAVARALGEDPAAYALHGGESFELLLAATGSLDEVECGVPLTRIGSAGPGAGLTLVTRDGAHPLAPDGAGRHEHFGG
jgi:thiamine-monophosphate kinase